MDKLAEEIGPTHGQNRHIRKFKMIKDRQNKIIYRDDYFQEATKGLRVADIPEDSGILTDQDVSLFSMKIRLFTYLDGINAV